MKRIAIYAAMIGILQFFFQGCSVQHNDLVVAEYGTNKITLGEFEKAYTKNSSQNKAVADSSKQYESFLDLYLKFKIKLEDAKKRGFDANVDVQNELIDYKKKVGITYLLEKQLVDPNLRRLWDMRHHEMRLSHLMIRHDSTGDEAARKKAQALLDSIKGGRSFEEMVKLYTQDSFSKPNGGDIYFFTAGTFIPEFEEAFYKTPVGQVYPDIIKTRYGYHILKVTEVRERIPEVHAAHILIDLLNEKGETDSVSARLRVDSVYNMITVQKQDFGALAKKYSKDQGSKENGGDLGFFGRRMMVKEFDEAAFNLKPGEISKPVRTQYGYHIIKLIERKPFPSYEDDKEAIKTNYKQYRYQTDYDTMTASLKKKYNYTLNQPVLDELEKKTDTLHVTQELFKHDWFNDFGHKVLYSIGGKNVTVDTFLIYMNSQSEYSSRPCKPAIYADAIKKHSADDALEVAALSLDKLNPEFAALMEDYRNGIYIFKLQEETVWNKIAIDSLKLVNYYDKNKEKFVWPDRIEFSEIFTRTDSIMTLCKELLAKGEDFDSVAAKYTERTNMKEKAGRNDLQDVNFSDITKEAAKLKTPGEVSAVFPNSGGKSLFKLVKKEASRIKTFEEARAEVSGAYQEDESKRLENEYLKSLEQVYMPVQHKDVLARAFKE